MKIEEFLNNGIEAEKVDESTFEESVNAEELDVQKAVVEELAAEKVICDEKINNLKREKEYLIAELASAKAKNEALVAQIGEMKKLLDNFGELLSKNAEGEMSNKIALLDRNLECEDRFTGETRDHVLEIIRETRDKDEADGRIRRAQLLESVLAANEPDGTLAKRRLEIEKLFNNNANILSGPVIEELTRLGISYKHGEEYLLPSEIIKRTF